MNSGSRKVCFVIVFCDMLKLVGNWFWGIAFVLFLATIVIAQQFGLILNPEKLPKTLVDIIPEIMGFLIAGLAIIMGFNEGTLKRLSKPANDNKIPLKVIIASFSVCLLILLTTLTVSILYVNVYCTREGCRQLISAFVLFGAVISIESVVHVIFHLFATGTYLINNNKD